MQATTVDTVQGVYFLAWSIETSINWNSALVLGCIICIICWMAAYPARWVWSHRLYKAGSPTVGQFMMMVGTWLLCSAGITSALVLLGVIGGLGLSGLGLTQSVVQRGTPIGLMQAASDGRPRKVYNPY